MGQRYEHAEIPINPRVLDKNGNPLSKGDIVLLDVFESKLRHTGITSLLGRIIDLDLPIIYSGTSYTCKIDIGANLPFRQRHASTVELAEGFEEEFKQQIAYYDNALMLTMLKSLAKDFI